jgi:hypothetical protein
MKNPIDNHDERRVEQLQKEERGIGGVGLIILAVVAVVIMVGFFTLKGHFPGM